MAKALFAVALWLCTSLSVLAATPQKKPPTWGELTQEQQQILAPLAGDWDNLEPARKRNWIGIAKRYPKMKPDEQARAQRRMQAWAKLTPEERQKARELAGVQIEPPVEKLLDSVGDLLFVHNSIPFALKAAAKACAAREQWVLTLP